MKNNKKLGLNNKPQSQRLKKNEKTELKTKPEKELKKRDINAKISENPSFADLGIPQSILDVLAKLGLETPTPIQVKAIPPALKGEDLIGVAQTGTGKTFAFGIPAINRIGKTKKRALVITPTRELAAQVEESLKEIGSQIGLKTTLIIGGDNFDRQLFSIRRNPHIIIGTPGRLMDHLRRRTLKLTEFNTLILDEADMMLDMGFMPQIKEIIKQVPKDRQTMLFSATMPPAIANLAKEFMKLPISIEVAPQGTAAAQVDQEIFIIKNEDRLDYLLKALAQYKGSVLVFVRTRYGVMGLTERLQALKYKAVEIHSNLSLSRRKNALLDFKSGRARILVATDVAARGLDIKGIELVVNYHLPENREDYVHRIGRTGRADQFGKAISFATPNQGREIANIERLINQEIKKTNFSKNEAGEAVKKIEYRSAKVFSSKRRFGSSRPSSRGGGSRRR